MSFNLTAGNPRAHRIRVYYEGSDTIYEGMALCYNHDTTDNWFGGSMSAGAVSATTTTAEGSQNEGKYIRVEKPATANMHWFAGAVAAGGWCGETGPRALDIYVPNGAIVPVYTDNNCTVDETIMAIENNSYKFTTPGWGRSVGLAMETVDRSGTAGLCLAKLEPTMFIAQGTDNRPLTVADEEGTCVMTNQMYVQSDQTAGSLCLVDFQGVLRGTGDFGGGMFKFKGHLNAAASNLVQTVSIGLDLQANAELSSSAGAADYCNCPLRVAIGTTGTPDLSTGSASNVLAAMCIGYHADESGGAPGSAYAFHFNSGTYNWDGLLNVMNAGDIGDSACTGNTAHDASDKAIPVRIAGNTYYIIAQDSKG